MSKGNNEELQGGRELPYLNQKDTYLGAILSRIIAAINDTAKNAAVSSVGKLAPPPPVDTIEVQGTISGNVITAPSELLHWTMTHNQAIQKGVQYVSEIDSDPNFPSPHIVDHGCSRTGFLNLATLDNDGNTNTYYLRSYAQYHGSDPAPPTVFGGLTGATKIVMTGTSKNSLLQSKGSGTASPNGQQGGHGLGKVLDRPAPGPKRNILKG